MQSDDRLRHALIRMMDPVESGVAVDVEPIISRGRRRRRATVAGALGSGLIVILAASIVGFVAIRHATRSVVAATKPQTKLIHSTYADIAVTISSTVVKPSQLFDLTISTTTFSGMSIASAIDFGDGSTTGQGFSMPGCPRMDTRPFPSTRIGSGQTDANAWSHAFRSPGRYKLHIAFTAYRICSSFNVPADAVDFVIVVAGGRVHSAGPIPPRMFGDQFFHTKDRGLITIDWLADDMDGYVAMFTLDWGDGTSPFTASYPLIDCHSPAKRWPHVARHGEISHRYRSPGVYQIHLTAVTTGCDGKDGRTAALTGSISTPASPPMWRDDVIPQGWLGTN